MSRFRPLLMATVMIAFCHLPARALASGGVKWEHPGAGGWVAAPGTVPATLAQLDLPDPKGHVAIGYAVVIIAGLFVMVGGVCAAIIGIAKVVELVRGPRGAVVLQQPVRTITDDKDVDRVEFDLRLAGFEEFKKQRAEDITELKAGIADLGEKIERFSSDNYKSRRRMHRQINAHENALAFMAGRLGRAGDEEGCMRVQSIIHRPQEGDEET